MRVRSLRQAFVAVLQKRADELLVEIETAREAADRERLGGATRGSSFLALPQALSRTGLTAALDLFSGWALRESHPEGDGEIRVPRICLKVPIELTHHCDTGCECSVSHVSHTLES